MHGDLGQGAREQALRAFRNGKVDVLVATDVAARGIDVEDVTHVINYECPDDEKTYLHRIGRTGRAGASGVAVTFVDWEDVPRWGMINKALGLPFDEPIETYHTSEHIYTGLGIPEGTTGRLPRAARTRAGLDAEVLEDLGGREPGGRSSGGRGSDGGRGTSRGHSHHHGRTIPHGHKEAPKSGAGAEAAEGEKAPRRRRPRNRKRTRGGQSVTPEQGGAPSGSEAEPRDAGSASLDSARGIRRRANAPASVEADPDPVTLGARRAAHPRRVGAADHRQVHARHRELHRPAVRHDGRVVALRARDGNRPQRGADRRAAEQGGLALHIHGRDARVGDRTGANAVEGLGHGRAPIRSAWAEVAVPSSRPRASAR